MTDDHNRFEWENVFFWYWLTRVVLNKIQRAVKWLCVCVSVCACVCMCMHACVHACMCACVHACVYACVQELKTVLCTVLKATYIVITMQCPWFLCSLCYCLNLFWFINWFTNWIIDSFLDWLLIHLFICLFIHSLHHGCDFAVAMGTVCWWAL